MGDTFTATLSNKSMTVSSFIARLEFDKEMLAVTKIEQLGGFAKLAADATIDPVLSTPDEANDRSLVGVGFVRGSDKTHEAGKFLQVTFQAKAAGNTAISLYEDSVGTNGYRGDAIVKSVVIEKPAYVLGDVNEDGKVNMTDVNRLFRYTTRKEISLTEAQLAAADVTGDGKVNITDVNRLFKFVTKQITTL